VSIVAAVQHTSDFQTDIVADGEHKMDECKTSSKD
jgi:hypothetical protein